MQCKYKSCNNCELVEIVTGYKSIPITEETCSLCQNEDKPSQINKITAGLCVVTLQKNKVLNFRKHSYLLTKVGIIDHTGVGFELHQILDKLKRVYSRFFRINNVPCNCDGVKAILNSWKPKKCWKERKWVLDSIKTNCNKLNVPYFKPFFTCVLIYALLKVMFLDEYMPIFKKQPLPIDNQSN